MRQLSCQLQEVCTYKVQAAVSAIFWLFLHRPVASTLQPSQLQSSSVFLFCGCIINLDLRVKWIKRSSLEKLIKFVLFSPIEIDDAASATVESFVSPVSARTEAEIGDRPAARITTAMVKRLIVRTSTNEG